MQAEGLKLLFRYIVIIVHQLIGHKPQMMRRSIFIVHNWFMQRMGKDFEQEIHVKLNPMMLTRPQFVLLNEKEVMLIWRSLLEDLWKLRINVSKFVFVASLNLIWHECSIVMSSLSETSTGGSSASTQFGELMEQELRLKREAAERAFEAQAEKDRTLMRLEELRFLATSTKDLDDDDAYWIKKQKRLIKNKMRNDLSDEDDEDE
ncbi:hypothetical protein Tco_1338779 [Tanacetum coccineum]